MNIVFATCDESRARDFIRAAYPGTQIDFDHPALKAVIDLVKIDAIRITDPAMGRPAIVGSANMTDQIKADLPITVRDMLNALCEMPEVTMESIVEGDQA